MTFESMTLSEFTEALSSKAATPGGGGASAAVGALGAALGAMVGNLTMGKKKYAAVEGEISALTEQAQALSRRLLALAEEDAAAFLPLSRAYAIPRDDPRREEVMETCLRQAAEPPLEILHCCCQAVELLEGFAQKGSVLAVSDAACGAALCRGAMESAAMNVRVNTRSIGDRTAAQALEREADGLLGEYVPRAQRIFDHIYYGEGKTNG
ncbi:MAG: cyclodeaminase/cyclohydrolase family protein [Oscillospiraceae bacterium]|nr:cyclodeaminase/cyclohydrolase family protein [Oscillospiraceae bacterium]